MKISYCTPLLLIFLIFISCGDKNGEASTTKNTEENIFDEKGAQSIQKDSVIYYNGLQNEINANFGEYFGFVFEADGQELQWQLESDIVSELYYVAESFEADIDSPKKEANGKQYFTFHALKAGNAKVSFKEKNSNKIKTIQIHIQ